MDLSNYATKANLKGASGADTSKLAAKSDLASLSEVDKVDVGKLKTVPIDSDSYSVRMRENTDQKLICIWTLFTQWVNNEVVKKTDYDGLVAKVNAVNTSGFFF